MSPARAMAIHTTAPQVIAAAMPSEPVWPSALRIKLVASRAAMVMPETGCEVEPIRPTMRAETTTKTKAKPTASSAAIRSR